MGIPLKVFDSSIVAVRALSPLAGVASILLLVIIASRLWNWRVALVAGILLTGSNAAIHYARLGMTNIYDPLIALAAMGAIAVAARYEKRQLWLLAGAAAGLTPYFFTSAHLFPIMLTALGILVAISPTRIQLRRQGRNIMAGALLALVVALPQLMHYVSFPEVFMERANTLGILQNGWLAREVEATGQTATAILQAQFRNALLLFNAQGDRSLAYNSGVPMLSFGPALLFLPALSLAIWRWRQFKYQVLLAWILVPVVFGGMLLVEPNSSHRLLIALPAVLILVAELFVWIGERLGELFDLESRRLLFYLLFAAALITLPDLLFYFGTYPQEGRFADRNTVIASEIASYLNDLDGEWRAYFHGAPHMYIDFPTIPFLVRTVEPYDTLLNVLEPGVPVVPDGTENATFIFLPERLQELSLVRDAYPGGLSETMVGNSMNPLFTVYEVTFR
jgi:4-amino-4-deoxy-L-arabinose transferase-like glycosyltransferase